MYFTKLDMPYGKSLDTQFGVGVSRACLRYCLETYDMILVGHPHHSLWTRVSNSVKDFVRIMAHFRLENLVKIC